MKKLGRWGSTKSKQPAPSNTGEKGASRIATASDEDKPNAGAGQSPPVNAQQNANQPPPHYDSIGPPGTLVAEYETLIPEFLGRLLILHVDSDPRMYVVRRAWSQLFTPQEIDLFTLVQLRHHHAAEHAGWLDGRV